MPHTNNDSQLSFTVTDHRSDQSRFTLSSVTLRNIISGALMLIIGIVLFVMHDFYATLIYDLQVLFSRTSPNHVIVILIASLLCVYGLHRIGSTLVSVKQRRNTHTHTLVVTAPDGCVLEIAPSNYSDKLASQDAPVSGGQAEEKQLLQLSPQDQRHVDVSSLENVDIDA